jgi:hypothetical protein
MNGRRSEDVHLQHRPPARAVQHYLAPLLTAVCSRCVRDRCMHAGNAGRKHWGQQWRQHPQHCLCVYVYCGSLGAAPRARPPGPVAPPAAPRAPAAAPPAAAATAAHAGPAPAPATTSNWVRIGALTGMHMGVTDTISPCAPAPSAAAAPSLQGSCTTCDRPCRGCMPAPAGPATVAMLDTGHRYSAATLLFH